MAERLPPTLVRRGFEQEVENERRNCLRAVRDVVRLTAAVDAALAEGRIPVADLRQLTVHATEAYQRAAAWAALDRVKFMLPGDETKG
jgi:hypothetical protein